MKEETIIPYLLVIGTTKQKRFTENLVCRKFNVEPIVLYEGRRDNINVPARYVLFWILITVFKWENQTVERIYNKDRSTINYGIKWVQKNDVDVIIKGWLNWSG